MKVDGECRIYVNVGPADEVVVRTLLDIISGSPLITTRLVLYLLSRTTLQRRLESRTQASIGEINTVISKWLKGHMKNVARYARDLSYLYVARNGQHEARLSILEFEEDKVGDYE